MQNSSFLLTKYVSWLRHSEGINLSDKLLLFFIKLYYLALVSFLRLALGKTRSKRLILKSGLDFGAVWYKSYIFWNKREERERHELLKFKMPKHDFEFYCRKNKDDFKTMTFHEDDILNYHFTPKEGDVVVDVGAHIGPYSIIASKRVGPNGKVVAIEADPDNFDLLSRNIQLNKLSNVIPLNYAAYSEAKKIKLYLPSAGEKSQYTKYNTIMSDRARNDEKFVEVKANTLDYLLQSKNMIKQEEKKVNWIKIDVEGAEYEVLKGAKNILSTSSNITLLIEIHNLSTGNVLYKPILEFLSLRNFKIEFENASESGERHIIARKISD
jgi:FkbM family methyltransferase